MTTEQFEPTVNVNKIRSEKNKDRVFHAVTILGSARPSTITKYILNEVSIAASNLYMNLDNNGIEKYVRKNSIDIRTVHRKLKELVKDGLVEKKGNGEYAISDLALSDLRFFTGEDAARFGQLVLGKILSWHYPTIFKMKDNLKRLVEMLGFYVLYCSLEATRPVPDTGQKPEDYLSKLFKDKLAVSWLDNVIDPKFILDACFSALTNQLSDREVEMVRKNDMIEIDNESCRYKNRPEDDFIGPPSTYIFQMHRFGYMYSERGRLEYRKKKTRPLYEMDKETILKIGNILQELYPDYYNLALDARGLLPGRPKESSLRNRVHTFRSFED